MLRKFAAQGLFLGEFDRLIDRRDCFGEVAVGGMCHGKNM